MHPTRRQRHPLLFTLVLALLLLPLVGHDHFAAGPHGDAAVTQLLGGALGDHDHHSDNLHGHNPADHASETAGIPAELPTTAIGLQRAEQRYSYSSTPTLIPPPKRPPRAGFHTA